MACSVSEGGRPGRLLGAGQVPPRQKLGLRRSCDFAPLNGQVGTAELCGALRWRCAACVENPQKDMGKNFWTPKLEHMQNMRVSSFLGPEIFSPLFACILQYSRCMAQVQLRGTNGAAALVTAHPQTGKMQHPT